MEGAPSNPEQVADAVPAERRQRNSRARSAGLREKVDGWCEKGILACVLALIVYAPIAFGGVRNSEFVIMLALGIVMMAFWAVRLAVRTQYRFLFAPFCWIVLAFTGYAIWHYTRADIEYSARIELLQIVLYAAVFFAVLDNLNRQETIQIILFTLVFAAMLNAFYAVFQYFTDSRSVLHYPKPPAYLGRGSGTYICPNHLAGLLELTLPIALAYTIVGRLKPLTKVFVAYAAVGLLAGIGVTISRAGYVTTAGALGVLFITLLWNRQFRLPAIGLLVVLIAAGSFFGFRSMRAQIRFWQLQEVNSRVLFWKPAITIWQDNFWTGVGPNHYDWRFPEHRHWQAQRRPLYTHNDYLNTLADYGTIGGVIIGSGLLLLTWGVFRSWKFVRRTNEIATKPSNRSAAVLGSAVGLFAIALHSAADFNMHIPANALIAVILMAVLTSHLRFATERFWVNPGWPGRLLAVLVLLGGMTFLSVHAFRLGLEAHYLGKAEALKLEPKAQLQAYRKAHEIEPMNAESALMIGELIRQEAWRGEEGYQDLAREALGWFERGIQLNPWDSHGYLKAGMCLHWLDDHEKAGDHFDKGLKMDPKSSFVLGFYGWHLLQLGDLEGAHKYLAEGYSYYRKENTMAKKYLDFVERKLAEQRENP